MSLTHLKGNDRRPINHVTEKQHVASLKVLLTAAIVIPLTLPVSFTTHVIAPVEFKDWSLPCKADWLKAQPRNLEIEVKRRETIGNRSRKTLTSALVQVFSEGNASIAKAAALLNYQPSFTFCSVPKHLALSSPAES